MPEIERGESGEIRRIRWTDAEIAAAYWRDCPWITARLKRRGWSAAAPVVRAFASWLFQRTNATNNVLAAVDDFLRRLEASPTLAQSMRAGVPIRNAAWLLQELTLAEAERLRAERAREPVDLHPALRDVPTRDLLDAASEMRRTAGLVPEAAEAIERKARLLDDAVLLRRLEAWARRRPPRKPRSPEQRVANAVDRLWAAPRRHRDAVTVALCAEVLGIETTEGRVRELMKPHRRTRERFTGI